MVDNWPLVSILIPLYNSEKYIKETLDSCLNQTYKNYEIIVVDDGSTDNSYYIVEEYASRFENIQVFHQQNGGACKARNAAFAKSKGEYILFLDADDFISSDFLELHVSKLKGERYSTISFCEWVKYYNGTSHPEVNRTPYRDYQNPVELIEKLLSDSMVQTSCWLTNRNLIELAGGWSEGLLLNQDGEFFLRVLANAQKALFIPDVLTYYRIENDFSISRSKISERKGLSLLQSYVSTKKYLSEKKLLTKGVKDGLIENFQMVAYIYMKFPNVVNQAKKEALELSPNSLPSKNGGKVFIICTKLFGFWNMLRIKKLMAR